jgi:small nuclear ribonucleoprotein G
VIERTTRQKDKRLKLSLNGNRKIVGTLRGYDGFLNVVLENAVDEATGADLCGGGGGGGGSGGGEIVIRGNSIIQFESVERITTSAST